MGPLTKASPASPTTSDRTGKSSSLTLQAIGLLTCGIFLLDLLTPWGLVLWLLYFWPLWLTSSLPQRRAPLVFAAISTALLLLGLFYAPAEGSFTKAALNRLVGLGVLWTMAVLLITRKQTEERLATSERRFRQVTENIREVFWLSPLDKNQILYVSPGYEEIWGRTCRSLYEHPRSWLDAIHSDDRERVLKAALEKQIRGEYDEEYRIIRPDGSIRWIRDRAFPIKDGSGLVYRVAGIAEDITAHKRAEERLAEINECFLRFGTDANKNINRLVALCGNLLGATCALYNRLDGDLLCSVGQWQTPPGYVPMVLAEGHICYDVIRNGSVHPLVVRNLLDTPYAQTDPNVARYHLQTYIGCAVEWRGKAIGALCAVFQQDYAPSEADYRLLGIIASAIGVEEERKWAADSLQESERRLRGVLEEREQICQDLHDDIIQSLYAIGLGLEESRRLCSHEESAAAPHVSAAIANLNLVIRTIRRNIIGLQPAISSGQELETALTSLIQRNGNGSGTKFRVTIDPAAARLTTPQEATHLFSIAREATSNCLRHSCARTAVVSLKRDNGGLSLTVEDDGLGFELRGGEQKGQGLVNIAARAKKLQAQLHIESAPGQGTRVALYLPKDKEGTQKEGAHGEGQADPAVAGGRS